MFVDGIVPFAMRAAYLDFLNVEAEYLTFVNDLVPLAATNEGFHDIDLDLIARRITGAGDDAHWQLGRRNPGYAELFLRQQRAQSVASSVSSGGGGPAREEKEGGPPPPQSSSAPVVALASEADRVRSFLSTRPLVLGALGGADALHRILQQVSPAHVLAVLEHFRGREDELVKALSSGAYVSFSQVYADFQSGKLK